MSDVAPRAEREGRCRDRERRLVARAAVARCGWPPRPSPVRSSTALAFLFVVPALRSAPDREPSRVSVLGPEGVTLSFDASRIRDLARWAAALVFTTVDPERHDQAVGRDRSRRLDARADRRAPRTGHLPFWSPDSRQIAFFTAGKLKKVPAAGGTVEVLVRRQGRPRRLVGMRRT